MGASTEEPQDRVRRAVESALEQIDSLDIAEEVLERIERLAAGEMCVVMLNKLAGFCNDRWHDNTTPARHCFEWCKPFNYEGRDLCSIMSLANPTAAPVCVCLSRGGKVISSREISPDWAWRRLKWRA